MTFSFRIRVNRSPTDTIQTEESELTLASHSNDQQIVLRSRNEMPIKESDQLSLVGSGFSTEEQANSAGHKYQIALMAALAKVRVGADFGQRAAKGVFTKHGLKWVEEKTGVRTLNNVHGLMVYKTEPKPKFASMGGQITRGTNRDSFLTALTTSINNNSIITDRELVAFTLFNASFFQPTSDSRFILLVMAIEALIEPVSRTPESIALVDSMIKGVKDKPLDEKEKTSIIGSLGWLKKESINQAGKRLVSSRLPAGSNYNDLSPAMFFSKCYQLRSNLVHGNMPFPTFEEIGNVVATLEVFVSELLTNHIFSVAE